MVKKLLEHFMKKNCKRLAKKSLEQRKYLKENVIIEKILKRKCDKLYVKWKGYDNSFNSWINKKDIV